MDYHPHRVYNWNHLAPKARELEGPYFERVIRIFDLHYENPAQMAEDLEDLLNEFRSLS